MSSAIQAQILDQQIGGVIERFPPDFLQSLNKPNENQKKSIALTIIALKKNLEVTEEEAYDCIVDGAEDHGIDAIIYDSPNDYEVQIVIFQSKYKQDLSGDFNFPENEIKKTITAIEMLLTPNQANLSVNKRLKEKITDIHGFIREGKIPSVKFILCNNGKIWNTSAEKIIASEKERFSGYVQWQHMGVDILTKPSSSESISADITLKGKAIYENFGYTSIVIGRLPVKELAKLMREHGDNLLQSNVRYYLKNTEVNREIITTLRDSSKRKNFYFYNNGITFICEKIIHAEVLREDWNLHLEDVQIINGGQTARTIEEAVRDLGEESLEGVDVLVRVYEISNSDEKFINAITHATNSQNPISLRDLKANDTRQEILRQSIEILPEIEGSKFTYNTKRPFSKSGELTSAVVAEAILAVWRKRPHQARFNTKQHFGVLYDIIFTQDLNGAQAVMATLIHRFCETRRKKSNGDSPAFLPYGSRFIAMQVGRYLLRDLGIDEAKFLTDKNFINAYTKFENEREKYYSWALNDVQNIIPIQDISNPLSLQQLSAFFRRHDSVEKLKDTPLSNDLLTE